MADRTNETALKWLFESGAPSFPADVSLPEGGTVNFPGMTLRDWFAGQAIPAIVRSTSAGQHHPIPPGSPTASLVEAMAIDAYALADAMLKARGGQ